MLKLSRLILPVGVTVLAAGWTSPAAAAGDTSPPSAIGNEVVVGMAVSPAYATTGLVAVAAADINKQTHYRLFISHDGGASWEEAAASGWNDSVPSIAVDASGKESLYAGDKNGLERSDDYGATWTKVGAAGMANPSPHFASDGTIAVPNMYTNGTDYALRNGTAQAIAGSNGSLVDHQYAFSPSYPNGGAKPAVFLSGDDPKSGYPVVEACSAAFSCTPSTPLPGSTTFSGFATLSLSSTFPSDGVVFAQSSSALYKSTNAAQTFTPMVPLSDATAAGIAYTGLVLAPGYSEQGSNRTVYAAEVLAYTSQSNPHTESGVFRSTDGGTTWTRLGIGTHLADNTNALAIAPDGRLFASFVYLRTSSPQAGLLCSGDGGNTWRTSCPHVGNYSGPTGTKVVPKSAQQGVSASGSGTGAGQAPSGSNGSGNGSGNGTAQGQAGGQIGGPGTTAPVAANVPHSTTQRNWALTIGLVGLAALLVGAGFVRRRGRPRGATAMKADGS